MAGMSIGLLPGGDHAAAVGVGGAEDGTPERVAGYMFGSNQRVFSDQELLDPDFPDVRLPSAEHRKQRHRYYRQQEAMSKKKLAVAVYSNGWMFTLQRLWLGKDAVEEG